MISYMAPAAFSLVLGFMRERRLFFVVILFGSLFVGLKGEVDKDYYNYAYLFDLSPQLHEGYNAFIDYLDFTSVEPGYLFLNSIVKTVGGGFNSVFFIISVSSFLLMYFICVSVPGNCYHVFIMLYAFSFIGLWVQVRFGLASVGVLSAMLLWGRGQIFLSFSLLFFSILFHAIALVSIFVVVLYFILSRLGAYLRVSIFLLFSISFIFAFFDVSNFLEGVLVAVNGRYAAYSILGGFSYVSVIKIALFLFLFLLIKKDALESRLGIILFSMVLLNCLVLSLAGEGVLYRVSALLDLGLCFFMFRGIYPSAINRVCAYFILYCLVFWRLYASSAELVEYHTFFVGYQYPAGHTLFYF